MTGPHRCYSCPKPATMQIESVGMSHRMTIWVCDDHNEVGAKVVAKMKNGIKMMRREQTIVTYEPEGEK